MTLGTRSKLRCADKELRLGDNQGLGEVVDRLLQEKSPVLSLTLDQTRTRVHFPGIIIYENINYNSRTISGT